MWIVQLNQSRAKTNKEHRWRMSRDGCTMFFLNTRGEVLLLLRDDNPAIPYPDILGTLQAGKSSRVNSRANAFAGEMGEELPGLDLGNSHMYEVMKFPQQTNYLFWTRININEEALD